MTERKPKTEHKRKNMGPDKEQRLKLQAVCEFRLFEASKDVDGMGRVEAVRALVDFVRGLGYHSVADAFGFWFAEHGPTSTNQV